MYGNMIDYFGLHTETLWLGANSTYEPNNWHWANGKSFTGTIENGNVAGKTQAYIVRNGNDVRFVAASPFDSYLTICDSSIPELECAVYPDGYWTGSSCLKKSAYLVSSSYEAWQNCESSGLASVDNLDEFSRWIDDSKKFWIGLRSAWWTWYDFVAGTSREAIDNRFGYSLPNSTSSGECLASFRYENSYIAWVNLDCARNLPFVCQKFVNETISTTTTTTTATALSSATRTSTTSTATTATIPIVTTQRTSSASAATTTNPTTTSAPTTPTATTPNSTTKTTTSSSASTTTTSTSSMSMTPATSGVTVDSSEGTADASTHRASDGKSTSTNYDLAIGLGVGGGFFLLVILWLALLTAYGYRKMRDANDSLKLLQRRDTTSTSTYDNRAFNNAYGNAVRRASQHPM